jgi:hypothetical protein
MMCVMQRGYKNYEDKTDVCDSEKGKRRRYEEWRGCCSHYHGIDYGVVQSVTEPTAFRKGWLV